MAFAAEPPVVSPMGTGYRTGTVMIDGQPITYTAGFERVTAGVRSSIYVPVVVARWHGTLTVVYNVTNIGSVTVTAPAGGKVTATGTTYSGYAQNPYPYSASVLSISEPLYIYGDSLVNFTLTA